MSLAEQTQLINHGLFNRDFPPGDTVEILSNGTHHVVNWQRLRPAVEALKEMSWYDLDEEWDYFLDTNRNPTGHQMELRPDEVNIFHRLVQTLVDQTAEGMRILSAVQPEISLTDITVTIDSTNLQTLVDAINHVRRTTELAAIDDAITVSSIQSGSLELLLTAEQVSLYGLQLAIVLAKVLMNPQMSEKARALKRLWERLSPDVPVEEETVHETVLAEARDAYWDSAAEPLKKALDAVGKNLPEAQNKINLAAKEIYDNADQVSANWKLPSATITGLPGGIEVSLNHEDPEYIGRVIRALSAPPDNTETDA